MCGGGKQGPSRPSGIETRLGDNADASGEGIPFEGVVERCQRLGGAVSRPVHVHREFEESDALHILYSDTIGGTCVCERKRTGGLI